MWLVRMWLRHDLLLVHLTIHMVVVMIIHGKPLMLMRRHLMWCALMVGSHGENMFVHIPLLV